MFVCQFYTILHVFIYKFQTLNRWLVSTIFRQTKEARNVEEIARWDESKKWQKKIEAVKAKLNEADLEVTKLSKDNKGKHIFQICFNN